MAVPIDIPTDNVEGFRFPTPSLAFVVWGLFDDSRFDWCEFSIHFFYSFLLTFLFVVFMNPDEHNSVGSAHTGVENPKSSFHSCFKRHL